MSRSAQIILSREEQLVLEGNDSDLKKPNQSGSYPSHSLDDQKLPKDFKDNEFFRIKKAKPPVLSHSQFGNVKTTNKSNYPDSYQPQLNDITKQSAKNNNKNIQNEHENTRINNNNKINHPLHVNKHKSKDTEPSYQKGTNDMDDPIHREVAPPASNDVTEHIDPPQMPPDGSATNNHSKNPRIQKLVVHHSHQAQLNRNNAKPNNEKANRQSYHPGGSRLSNISSRGVSLAVTPDTANHHEDEEEQVSDTDGTLRLTTTKATAAAIRNPNENNNAAADNSTPLEHSEPDESDNNNNNNAHKNKFGVDDDGDGSNGALGYVSPANSAWTTATSNKNHTRKNNGTATKRGGPGGDNNYNNHDIDDDVGNVGHNHHSDPEINNEGDNINPIDGINANHNIESNTGDDNINLTVNPVDSGGSYTHFSGSRSNNNMVLSKVLQLQPSASALGNTNTNVNISKTNRTISSLMYNSENINRVESSNLQSIDDLDLNDLIESLGSSSNSNQLYHSNTNDSFSGLNNSPSQEKDNPASLKYFDIPLSQFPIEDDVLTVDPFYIDQARQLLKIIEELDKSSPSSFPSNVYRMLIPDPKRPKNKFKFSVKSSGVVSEQKLKQKEATPLIYGAAAVLVTRKEIHHLESTHPTLIKQLRIFKIDSVNECIRTGSSLNNPNRLNDHSNSAPNCHDNQSESGVPTTNNMDSNLNKLYAIALPNSFLHLVGTTAKTNAIIKMAPKIKIKYSLCMGKLFFYNTLFSLTKTVRLAIYEGDQIHVNKSNSLDKFLYSESDRKNEFNDNNNTNHKNHGAKKKKQTRKAPQKRKQFTISDDEDMDRDDGPEDNNNGNSDPPSHDYHEGKKYKKQTTKSESNARVKRQQSNIPDNEDESSPPHTSDSENEGSRSFMTSTHRNRNNNHHHNQSRTSLSVITHQRVSHSGEARDELAEDAQRREDKFKRDLSANGLFRLINVFQKHQIADWRVFHGVSEEDLIEMKISSLLRKKLLAYIKENESTLFTS